MQSAALLVSACLFGGMVLYAFGFAPFLFSALPADQAGPLIRRAFPWFYLLVMVCSALAAALLLAVDPLSASLMAAILLTTVPTRQVLMPAINAATDAGQSGRFKLHHTLSVVITLAHIIAVAYVLTRFL
ncbi:DUF4149 domain-containing protein [Labrenzia sp. VG12]|uniref:DUF4149 domain-containing protein n=1 Tax=Labrenzia sp. VG12 TaxID=2021862 RepID=UPI000B8C32DD|nr:DUF4149 domain-containing protein [Labrenzia sp. VG12]ASP35808.1 hypothetical protein CHH27_23310 [Labrenzia sp. VG12]